MGSSLLIILFSINTCSLFVVLKLYFFFFFISLKCLKLDTAAFHPNFVGIVDQNLPLIPHPPSTFVDGDCSFALAVLSCPS